MRTASSTGRAGRKKGGTTARAKAAAQGARGATGTARWAPICSRPRRAVDIHCTADYSDDDVEPGDEDSDGGGDFEPGDEVTDAFAEAPARAATPARRSRESAFPR